MVNLISEELMNNTFIKELFKEIIIIIQSKEEIFQGISFDSAKNVSLMGIPVKNFNAEQWRNSIALKSRSRLFKRELKMFLSKLENSEKHELFNKLNIIAYDENGVAKTISLKELETQFLDQAIHEYETAYLNYIGRQIAKDKDYQFVGVSSPYDETYLGTGSDYHYRPESYVASPDDQIIKSDQEILPDKNAVSEFVPSDSIVGLIDRLKMELTFYRVGMILERLYNDIKAAETINTTTAMGYSMRLSAILAFISKSAYTNIAAYMFNNYNWSEEFLPLKADDLIDRIKDIFRTAIYSKNPQNKAYSPELYPAEFTDTAGSKNEAVEYGTAFAIRSEQRISTGNFLDDVIAYLSSAIDSNYQQAGRQLGIIQKFIFETKISDNLAGLKTINQMIESACEGMTLQMAKDISANTIADNASFDRQEILSGIKKGFYELLKENRVLTSYVDHIESKQIAEDNIINDNSIDDVFNQSPFGK